MLLEDQEVYTVALEALDLGQTIAIATIIHAQGSTPRGAGAKIVFLPDGRTAGTIGGGCAEAEIRRTAIDVLQGGSSRIVRIDLTASAEEAGMECGGVMDVFIEGVNGSEQPDAEAWELIREAMDSSETFCRAVIIDQITGQRMLVATTDRRTTGMEHNPYLAAAIGREAIASLEDGRSVLKTVSTSREGSDAEVRVLFDILTSPAQVLVLGGGHVSRALVKTAAMLGFNVTVVDDRPSFANRERFPDADNVICDYYLSAMEKYKYTPNTYAVIVTRGHKHDLECLQYLVNIDMAYLGMIGSKRKVRELFQFLRETGVPQERLDRVHSPIGLSIGAETPEEIAVAVAAEMVMARRLGPRYTGTISCSISGS